MHARQRKRGFTMIEVITVAGILGLLAGIISMTWVAVVKSYDGVTTQNDTNSDAVTCMQRIVTDVREAKSIEYLDTNKRLRVRFPILVNGYYDRHQADANHYVDYYRSDSTGALNRYTGIWLWRKEVTAAGTEMRAIARDICAVTFVPDTERSVEITVETSNPSVAGTKSTELTQRVVYLRNN